MTSTQKKRIFEKQQFRKYIGPHFRFCVCCDCMQEATSKLTEPDYADRPKYLQFWCAVCGSYLGAERIG